MELIFIAAILGLIPAFIAKGKGRDFISWWFYGALLFIVAIIHSILLKDNKQMPLEKSNMNDQTETNTTMPNTKNDYIEKKPGYLKYGIILVVVLLLTLPFHYLPSHLMVFPKDNFTFSNTFIFQSDIDQLIEKYNSNNLIEKMSMMNEPLFKKLKEKGLIYNIDETKSNKNLFNQSDVPTNNNSQTTTIIDNDTPEYSVEDKKVIDKIKQKSIRDFPDNYTMQKMIFDQAVEAYFYMKTVSDLKIKRKMERDYPNDYFMQKLIYDQEIEAKEKMK